MGLCNWYYLFSNLTHLLSLADFLHQASCRRLILKMLVNGLPNVGGRICLLRGGWNLQKVIVLEVHIFFSPFR